MVLDTYVLQLFSLVGQNFIIDGFTVQVPQCFRQLQDDTGLSIIFK